MPPKAAKGAAPTPLDKKLAASAGKEGDSVWNIAQLKQNLQEDSALLEQTLREANQLLVSTSGVPLVDIKGHVSKEAQLKKLKELLPEETSELEARREPVQATVPPADAVEPGTFMTELSGSSASTKPCLLGPGQARMSDELAQRLDALEDSLGRETSQLLKSSVQRDLNQVCVLSRRDSAAKGAVGDTGGGDNLDGLEEQLMEMEALKVAAEEQVAALQESQRVQGARLAELQAKHELLDSSSAQGGELVRKLESEAKSLKDDLLAAQHKTRVEEGERHKLVEKLRKKEVEVAKIKESMDKMTLQLQRLGEERDKMSVSLEEKRREHAEGKQRSDAIEAELRKLQSAKRVLKRNMQLQMPDDTKKIVARLEQLEKVNKDLNDKVRALKDTDGADAERRRMKAELTELRVSNRSLTARCEELEQEKKRMTQASEAQRRLLENRSRSLLDKSTKSSQKLQAENELRIAERLQNRSADNELTALRKRNLDLVSKMNAVEDQCMEQAAALRDSQRRCHELSEKLELYATAHRIDLARLQYNPDVRAELENEQKRLHTSSTMRLRRTAGSAASRASTAMATDRRRAASDGRVSAPPEVETISSRPPTRDRAECMPSISGTRSEENLQGGARGDADEGVEGLRKKVQQLQGKLAQEERARTVAADKCVSLAEQLLEKEAAMQKMQANADQEKANGRRQKKSERLREIEAQLQLTATKVRETAARQQRTSLDAKRCCPGDQLSSLARDSGDDQFLFLFFV